MKNRLLKLCLLVIVITSCNTQSPEKIFSQAVLNTNLFFGFAGNAEFRQLESPSVKLVPGTTDKTVPMKRAEIIQDKIDMLSVSFNKIKKLSASGDAKVMVESSVALYEYILPVYKTEYMQLAKLYDERAPVEQIEQLSELIQSKYQPGFIVLKDKLTVAGKVYAQKNNINVRWDVSTTP
jgi:hypothetical protein